MTTSARGAQVCLTDYRRYGGEIGLRAEVVFGPYGVESSAIVVVGATIMSPVVHRFYLGSSMVRM